MIEKIFEKTIKLTIAAFGAYGAWHFLRYSMMRHEEESIYQLWKNEDITQEESGRMYKELHDRYDEC